METEAVKIEFPKGFEQSVQMTPQELERDIRFMAALKMFELGKLSSGRAAELAGIGKWEFLEMCGRYQVSVFNYEDEKIQQELNEDLNSLKDFLDR